MANQADDGLIRTNFTWADQEYPLSEFLDLFELPQLVKVAEGSGIYDTTEEDTLPSGQVLILHTIQTTELYVGHTYENREVFLPFKCQDKVEVRPQNVSMIYETAGELCEVFPGLVKYVRATKDHFDKQGSERSFRKGTKLKLDYILKDDPDNPLLMCLDEEGCEIVLTMDVKGGFQPLDGNNEYLLREITDHYGLPVYVQFAGMPTFAKSERYQEKYNTQYLQSPIQLDSVVVENTVIASTKMAGEMGILTLPRNLDVTVVLPNQAFQDNSHVCRYLLRLNNKINTAKLEVGYVYTSRNTVDLLPYPNTDKEEEDAIYLVINDDGQDVFICYPKVAVTEVNRNRGCLATLRCLCGRMLCLRRHEQQEDEDKPPPLPDRDFHLQNVQGGHGNQGFALAPRATEKKIQDMSEDDVALFLDELGLEEFSEKFRRDQVNGQLLLDINLEMLQKHFKMSIFEALKLYRAVNNQQ